MPFSRRCATVIVHPQPQNIDATNITGITKTITNPGSQITIDQQPLYPQPTKLPSTSTDVFVEIFTVQVQSTAIIGTPTTCD